MQCTRVVLYRLIVVLIQLLSNLGQIMHLLVILAIGVLNYILLNLGIHWLLEIRDLRLELSQLVYK